MTICISIFIHSSYIYIHDTQYMLHTTVPDLPSTVLGRPRVSMDSEVKHSERGFQMDRFSYTTQGFYFSYIGGMCLYWGTCFHKFKYHNLDEHFDV